MVISERKVSGLCQLKIHKWFLLQPNQNRASKIVSAGVQVAQKSQADLPIPSNNMYRQTLTKMLVYVCPFLSSRRPCFCAPRDSCRSRRLPLAPWRSSVTAAHARLKTKTFEISKAAAYLFGSRKTASIGPLESIVLPEKRGGGGGCTSVLIGGECITLIPVPLHKT